MEEEGEGERGGTTLWRKREEVRGVVPPCGGRRRAGEGWYHRVEEEGEGERGLHLLAVIRTSRGDC